MAHLLGLRQDRGAALSKAEGIVATAERAGRELTAIEAADFNQSMREVEALTPQIEAAERRTTLRIGADGIPTAKRPDGTYGPIGLGGGKTAEPARKVLSSDYGIAFKEWLLSGGERVSAALYEAAGSAGGFSVPTTVAGEIVPLVAPESAVRRLATTIVTSNDLLIPRQSAFSVSAGKLESGATQNLFQETSPALDQIRLSAFMGGAFARASFEILQDSASFQGFIVSDLQLAQFELEEQWFVNGTGVNMAQGLLGNVASGTVAEPDAQGNLIGLDSLLDLIGSVPEPFLANATFLMNRGSSILIRKAARQANSFQPVWSTSNGTDYLFGLPVAYSAAMPAAARGATPVLLGDFAQGYVVGLRGGPGISVKILDQPWAVAGQVGMLVYRRLDGRVRRPAAIRSFAIAAS